MQHHTRQQTQPTQYIGRAKRLFEIVRYLQEYRTAFDIAEHFQIHIQTARMALTALQQIGFAVVQRRGRSRTQYKVENVLEYFRDTCDSPKNEHSARA